MKIGIIASTILERDYEQKSQFLNQIIEQINPDEIYISSHIKYDTLIYSFIEKYQSKIVTYQFSDLEYQMQFNSKRIETIEYSTDPSIKTLQDLFILRNIIFESNVDLLIFIKSNLSLPVFDAFYSQCNIEKLLI